MKRPRPPVEIKRPNTQNLKPRRDNPVWAIGLRGVSRVGSGGTTCRVGRRLGQRWNVRKQTHEGLEKGRRVHGRGRKQSQKAEGSVLSL